MMCWSTNRKAGLLALAGCACCVLGLGIDTTWCILMGYTPAFVPEGGIAGFLANPRLFFLVGVLAFTLLCIALPSWIRRCDKVLRFALPCVGALGTICFSLPTRGLADTLAPIVLFGLALTGAVQFWLAARFVLLLARSRGVTTVIVAVAGWLVVKLPLVELANGITSPGVQIVCATAAPVLAAALFEAACAFLRHAAVLEQPNACARSEHTTNQPLRTVFGVPQRAEVHPPVKHSDQTTMCLLLFVAAAVLGVVRSVSYMGLWGTMHPSVSDALPWVLGVLVPGALVVAFAYGALVKTSELPLATRFWPALFLTLTGLFAAAIQSSPSGTELAALSVVVQVCQLFAHLLFWTVIATALDVLNVPSYRTVGIAESVYAMVSILYVAVLANQPIIVTLVTMLVLYVIVIGLLYTVWVIASRHGADTTADTVRLDTDAKVAAQPILEHCAQLAVEKGLSPRETEVFLLLVQGRSHSFIQDELGMAASTVKTHVSHIYTKLDVCGRQELLDLTWRE